MPSLTLILSPFYTQVTQGSERAIHWSKVLHEDTFLLFKPGEEQTRADFEKLAFRGGFRLILYDLKRKPLVLALCLHGIYTDCGVLTDPSGKLVAKDGTEESGRMRDVDSHPDTAGQLSVPHSVRLQNGM